MKCPFCASEHLNYSRPRTRWERWRQYFGSKQLYRCYDCHWRGWLKEVYFQPYAEKKKNAIAYSVMIAISIVVTVLVLPYLN
jgi:hypothetical protein